MEEGHGDTGSTPTGEDPAKPRPLESTTEAKKTDTNQKIRKRRTKAIQKNIRDQVYCMYMH